jgi:hypothetical protein
MEGARSFATRTLKVVGFGLLAFAITILAGGIWSGLVVANLQSSPAVPWSVPVMALLLWLAWSYLGGKGWPRGTSEVRRRYLRANRNSGPTYLWAWVAGVLSVVALAGYWILLFQLVKMPPNALSDVSSYPRMTVALMILMGVVCCSFDGGGRVSRIFSDRTRTRVSRSSRSRDRIGSVCACARSDAGLPVAQASLLLSRGCCLRGDGPPHQFDPASYPGPHCGTPDLLHLDLAAGCRATAGLGARDGQLVLDTRDASDHIYGTGSLGVSAAGESEHARAGLGSETNLAAQEAAAS